MENLFAIKKKFSFMATELSDKEEVIEAVGQYREALPAGNGTL